MVRFRRAVVYRSAGVAVGLLAPVSSEGFDAIVTHRREVPKWKEVQYAHFAAADAEIARLRSSFPDDAFLTDVESRKGVAGLSFAVLA